MPHATSTVILGCGALCGCVAAIFDLAIRLRMQSIGRKFVFLRIGGFKYGEYLAARAKYGWAAWPVYFMWTLLAVGAAFLAAGAYFHAVGR
jgi:hypothetical protein